MKKSMRSAVLMVCLSRIFSGKARAVDMELARYATAREKQNHAYGEMLTNKVPGIVWSFFDAVPVDSCDTATNLVAHKNQARGWFETTDTNALIALPLRRVLRPASRCGRRSAARGQGSMVCRVPGLHPIHTGASD